MTQKDKTTQGCAAAAKSISNPFLDLLSSAVRVGALCLPLLAMPSHATAASAPSKVRNCGSASAPWPCSAEHPPLRPDLVPAPRAKKVVDFTKHPDFTGRWLQDQGVSFTDPTPLHGSGAHPTFDDTINPAPLNPEYQRRYEQSLTPEAVAARAKAVPANPKCNPQKMPGIIRSPFASEIAYGDDRMFMISEFQSAVRRIYLDGRPHPSLDDFDPSYTGHSIGHWEGDTLVVDTTLITPELGIQIQGAAAPATPDLRIVERMRLIEGGKKLEVMVTFHDPKVYSKPWTVRRTWTRQSSEADVVEYECVSPPDE
jgi:hypothetical protein